MTTLLKATEIPHSRLGASSSDRWMNCTASSAYLAKVPREKFKTNRYQAEGTAAHELSAACLENGVDAWEYYGTTIQVEEFEFVVDEEMMDAVQLFLNHVRALMSSLENERPVMYVERRMKSLLDEEAYGTGDVVIVTTQRIVVCDYKHGAGKVVEADTAQTRYYGYLAIEEFDAFNAKEVECWITQPRIPHPDGINRVARYSVEDTIAWFSGYVIDKMNENRDGTGVLKMGDWCGFCEAKTICPAMKKSMREFPIIENPETLTPEELGELVVLGDLLKKMIADLEKEAYSRASRGVKVRGRKLVKKKSNRAWMEGKKDTVVEELGEKAWKPRELISPAEAEKLGDVGKRVVAKYAHQPSTGLTIAPESDTRSEVKPLMDSFLDTEASG